MAGLINKEDELARLAKEVAKIEGEISRILWLVGGRRYHQTYALCPRRQYVTAVG